MTIESALLTRLEEEQLAIAKAALTSPMQRDAFEYGRVAGIYAGLEKARLMLVDLLNDADRAEREF